MQLIQNISLKEIKTVLNHNILMYRRNHFVALIPQFSLSVWGVLSDWEYLVLSHTIHVPNVLCYCFQQRTCWALVILYPVCRETRLALGAPCVGHGICLIALHNTLELTTYKIVCPSSSKPKPKAFRSLLLLPAT